METIPANSILSAYRKSGWFGSNYTANLYRGCSHGCIYCDSRSACYRIDNFDTVRGKEGVSAVLRRELSRKEKGTILTGAMSDPYNPCEREAELTRTFLTLAARYRFGVVILTKSDLVTRDIDLLTEIGKKAPAAVNVTITALENAVSRTIEPHAPSSDARFLTLEQLSQRSIIAGVVLLPVLPFITDTKENIAGIVSRAADAGVSYIYAEQSMGVTLRDRQREYFYDRLGEKYPGLKARYGEMYGEKYLCSSPKHESLWETFVSECQAANIIWQHEKIRDLLTYTKREKQTTLF